MIDLINSFLFLFYLTCIPFAGVALAFENLKNYREETIPHLRKYHFALIGIGIFLTVTSLLWYFSIYMKYVVPYQRETSVIVTEVFFIA